MEQPCYISVFGFCTVSGVVWNAWHWSTTHTKADAIKEAERLKVSTDVRTAIYVPILCRELSNGQFSYEAIKP